MKRPVFQAIKQTVVYVATHYTWAFAVVMVVTLVSCVFSIHYLASLETNLRDVYENDVQGGHAIQAAYTGLLGLEGAVKDLVLFPDKKNQTRLRAVVKQKAALVQSSLNLAEPRFYTPKAKTALQRAKADWKVVQLSLQGLLVGGPVDTKLVAALETKSGVLQRDFDLLIANRKANSTNGISDLVSQLRFSLGFTVVLLILTVVVRVIIYWMGHPRRRVSKG